MVIRHHRFPYSPPFSARVFEKMRHMAASVVSRHRLIEMYERKTREILKRYGPGPRVHYHTGLVDEPPSIGASGEELRRELIAAPERTLEYAAEVWDAASGLCGDVLDVGRGLGGAALFS